jgi:hypothetical protein
MTTAQKKCLIALVDPSLEFASFEDTWQPSLRPNIIAAYRDDKKFLQDMQSPEVRSQYDCLVVVADSAGLLPTVEDGVICRTLKTWDNSAALAFTADRTNPAWKTAGLSSKDIISRGTPDGAVKLLAAIKRKVDSLGGTTCRRGGLISDERPLHVEVESQHDSEGIAKQQGVLSESNTQPSEGTLNSEGRSTHHSSILPETPTVADRERGHVHWTQPMVRLENLVKPKTYLHRLLTADALGFFQRFLLRQIAWGLFTKLSHSDPERLEKYRLLLNSRDKKPEPPGRELVRDVLSHFPRNQQCQEYQSNE